MRWRIAAAVLALAGCAGAPVTRMGGDEWAIGESTRDGWRSDATVRHRQYQQAVKICGESRVETFDITPADGRFHFRCIAPERSRQQDIDAARAAWRTCLEAEEPAVDDMLSDGHTIAAVLATRCSPEVALLLALAGKGFQNWYMSEEALQRVRRDVALDVVLRTRAMKRNPNVVPPQVVIPDIGPGR